MRRCDVDVQLDAQVALHPVGSQLYIRVRRLGMDEEPWNKQVGAGRGSGESGHGETWPRSQPSRGDYDHRPRNGRQDQ